MCRTVRSRCLATWVIIQRSPFFTQSGGDKSESTVVTAGDAHISDIGLIAVG